MVLETAKQRYKNRTGFEFKCLHWWKAMRHQPKWRERSASLSTTDPFVSSSEVATEEEMTHPIGRNRAKSAARKEKGKKDSSSQSESSSIIGGIMSTLKKLSTTFTKAHMWKQYNKLHDRSTTNMNTEELTSHPEAIRFIEIDLYFTIQNAADVQDEDDKYNIYVLYFKLV
jgi:hypothetical protein